MLIRRAEIDGRLLDLRIEATRITELGEALPARPDELLIDAAGGLLIPGLHDHHLHLQSLAAARASVFCGPPQVRDAEVLAHRLREAAAQGSGWLRGIGFHESLMGDEPMDRRWLDRVVPDRPLRVQQRSGRLWILNSCALDRLGVADAGGDDPCERIDGRLSGRLYDADAWLRSRLRGQRPDLAETSRWLASLGVTGLTDTSHDNGPDELRHFAAAQSRGELLQSLMAMGDARLDAFGDLGGVQRGAHKFHLHDTDLPELDDVVAAIRRSRAAGRGNAFHCVSRTDLVFALAALRDAGAATGDRIEHAGVAPPELVEQIAELGLTVVTQPNFIAERGDAYLDEVDADDRPWLYRLRGLLDAGIPLAGSTDAPFGDADPWAAMQAAVTRRAPDGRLVGASEALTPEQSLALFLSPLPTPGTAPRRIGIGAAADLCLLREGWQQARQDLAAVRVRATISQGQLVFRSED